MHVRGVVKNNLFQLSAMLQYKGIETCKLYSKFPCYAFHPVPSLFRFPL